MTLQHNNYLKNIASSSLYSHLSSCAFVSLTRSLYHTSLPVPCPTLLTICLSPIPVPCSSLFPFLPFFPNFLNYATLRNTV